MMAYRAAGITIPRTSQQQWAKGPRVPASRARPGDLVFFAGSDETPFSGGPDGGVPVNFRVRPAQGGTGGDAGSATGVVQAGPEPGDLVFFAGADGTMSSPGHVGIVLGGGLMVDAPGAGQRVMIDRTVAGATS